MSGCIIETQSWDDDAQYERLVQSLNVIEVCGTPHSGYHDALPTPHFTSLAIFKMYHDQSPAAFYPLGHHCCYLMLRSC